MCVAPRNIKYFVTQHISFTYTHNQICNQITYKYSQLVAGGWLARVVMMVWHFSLPACVSYICMYPFTTNSFKLMVLSLFKFVRRLMMKAEYTFTVRRSFLLFSEWSTSVAAKEFMLIVDAPLSLSLHFIIKSAPEKINIATKLYNTDERRPCVMHFELA